MAEAQFGITTFRTNGKWVEVLYGTEWLRAWEIIVVNNQNDLAIDTDLENDIVRIVHRNSEKPTTVSRFLPKNDVLMIKLENGRLLTMESSPVAEKLLAFLIKNGCLPKRMGVK